MKSFKFDDAGGLDATMDSAFRAILEKGGIEALFVMKKTGDGLYIPTLISDARKAQHMNPFAGIMPVNAATLVSNITRITPAPGNIAVVLKPCEHRALVELVKLKQVSLDNVVVIVTDCPGTFHVAEYKEIAGGKGAADGIALAEKEERIRLACRVCELCTAQGEDYDIRLRLPGADNALYFEAATDKGTQLLNKAGAKESPLPADIEKKTVEIISRRKKANADVTVKEKARFVGIDNLAQALNRCISCHNCMDACPICYCKECFFESPTFEYEAEKYLRWAGRKGSIRMPVGTVMFHLGRLNHMAVSCVGCGMCEQACPAKIELLALFKGVGEDLQKRFQYSPGRSTKDSLPLIVYQEEEFEPR